MRFVVAAKTEKVNIWLLCSFSSNHIIRHSNKIWAIKMGYWFSGLFRNPAAASQIVGVFRRKPFMITKTTAGYDIVSIP